MLKWTASAQKLQSETSSSTLHTSNSAITTTPHVIEKKRRKRRATIANKENVPILTSTPMVERTRNSPLVLAPLADILNVTPETIHNRTLETKRVSINAFRHTNAATNRRHSSVGFTRPPVAQYAATLPKYEEEYSPSTMLPTGQQLALRGLLPDAFMENPRYFNTPVVSLEQKLNVSTKSCSLPKKRKLEQEFVAIAKAAQQAVSDNKKHLNHTALTSNKMGDKTLDNLIDAILDSARKEEKKKKPRKSFNLRRRTLLKNQAEQQQDLTLSPSYTAGDDPCTDVSFLNCESLNSPIPATPQPAIPPPHTPLSRQLLLQLPTPAKRKDSFSLATPVRSKLKRRSESNARLDTTAKKYKMDSGNYFEIGVALPSVYV